MSASEPSFVNYQQEAERLKKAGILRMTPPSIDTFTDDEIRCLIHLMKASDLMNQIFRWQFCEDTPRLLTLCQKLLSLPALTPDERQKVADYVTMIHLQNSPFSEQPRKNNLLSLAPERVAALAAQAGVPAPEYEALSKYLFKGLEPHSMASFYPHDLTEEEFRALGDEATLVNTTVERRDGRLRVVRNEERFGDVLRPVIDHLTEARKLAADPDFCLYLEAKARPPCPPTAQPSHCPTITLPNHHTAQPSHCPTITLPNHHTAQPSHCPNFTLLGPDPGAQTVGWAGRRRLTAFSDLGAGAGAEAQIEELRTGSPEARRVADALWVRNDFKMDLILSTALEVYLDDWKNLKGAACGSVVLRNPAMDEILAKIKALAAHVEAHAPSPFFRHDHRQVKLPHLRVVDVATWSGDYVSSPFTVIAQSLPNDEWLVKQAGSVNMLYYNTGNASYALVGQARAEASLPAPVARRYRELFFQGDQIHSMLHEIGHTTGQMDPDHQRGEPRDYLNEEYSTFEEARAELYGMHAIRALAHRGVLPPELAEASDYHMLVTMLAALEHPPQQAHTKVGPHPPPTTAECLWPGLAWLGLASLISGRLGGPMGAGRGVAQARNMMFHFFRKAGAIVTVEEAGQTKYDLVFGQLVPAVDQLLGIVQEIKSTGDKARATRFREEYCIYEEEIRRQLLERTAHLVQGRGYIFPALRILPPGAPVPADAVRGKTLATGETAVWTYPESFIAQEKFNC
ncbi:hypothetical protein PAPYR_799 [Paratrimastix pyriformis]|uniref:Uncharacterized protein n=1 Tax=Paratrimastix pyriformis TaxID=342808 RepID=A0ABQ8UUH3_9EUKA|nr:hypothetical protein PAPYR_799 [Paratrimastix pyriformis]